MSEIIKKIVGIMSSIISRDQKRLTGEEKIVMYNR